LIFRSDKGEFHPEVWLALARLANECHRYYPKYLHLLDEYAAIKLKGELSLPLMVFLLFLSFSCSFKPVALPPWNPSRVA